MTTKPTVFIVDDDPGMRKSLHCLLESVDLQVETFSAAQDYLDAYDPSRPGCLVLDVRMPGMSGLDLQEKLRTQQIAIPFIVISGFADVPTAVRAMKNGAVDFIEKPFSDQTLLDRIQEAIELDAHIRLDQAQHEEIADRLSHLTAREREVMDLVVAGNSTKDIAGKLGLSSKTVEVHRAHVMNKIQAKSVAELVRLVTLQEPLDDGSYEEARPDEDDSGG